MRSWAGLKDAAKTLRKTKISSGVEVEYTAYDRKIAFERIARKAMQDNIYCAAVKASPIHEINKVGHKEIYLEGVPRTSVVWTYIKNKGANIVHANDIMQF